MNLAMPARVCSPAAYGIRGIALIYSYGLLCSTAEVVAHRVGHSFAWVTVIAFRQWREVGVWRRHVGLLACECTVEH